MILLINGPFGVGKTTVARLLIRRLPRSTLFDPEWVGLGLRFLGSTTADFQDDPRWVRHVVRGARLLSALGRDLVVPITLWRAETYSAIVDGLSPALSLCLTASEPILSARIARGDPKPAAWRQAHLPQCLTAFTDDRLGRRLATDRLSADQLADRIETVWLSELARLGPGSRGA